MKKVGKKKSSVRDTWIPETWRYNGAGYKVNKKGVIPRKQYLTISGKICYNVYVNKRNGV